MTKILKVSSRDGTFVRGGISFPPAPDAVELDTANMDQSIVESIANESALIVQEVSGTTTAPDNKPGEKTVAQLKQDRQALVEKIRELYKESEELISDLTKGSKKADVLNDIEMLTDLLAESNNTNKDKTLSDTGE